VLKKKFCFPLVQITSLREYDKPAALLEGLLRFQTFGFVFHEEITYPGTSQTASITQNNCLYEDLSQPTKRSLTWYARRRRPSCLQQQQQLYKHLSTFVQLHHVFTNHSQGLGIRHIERPLAQGLRYQGGIDPHNFAC